MYTLSVTVFTLSMGVFTLSVTVYTLSVTVSGLVELRRGKELADCSSLVLLVLFSHS